MSETKPAAKKATKPAPKKSGAGPEGSSHLATNVSKPTRDLLEARLAKLEAATGKKVSLYTLLQYAITTDALDKAEVQIVSKLKEYEELERKQQELGIHLLG